MDCFVDHQLFYEALNKKINLKSSTSEKNDILKKQSFSISFIKNFMDDRSRTVDTICFLIILEIIYELSYFSQIIFGLYFLKSIIIFFGRFYIFYIKGRLEKEV